MTYIKGDNPNAKSKIYQGITTEIIGNCGFSPFPLKDEQSFVEKRRESLGFIDVKQVDWNWKDIDGYYQTIKKAMPNVNLVTLVGHGSIRAMVKGYENSKATPKELSKMQEILAAHFEKGVYGISTGLGYSPDFYSDLDELTALAEVVKEYDCIFAFHIRGERATLFTAVNEALSVGKRSGAKIEISHLKCAGRLNYGRADELLNMIEAAIKDGAGVDMYPYTAGNSYLGISSLDP
jgi:N-acyl-D-amino-acid deacylase